MDTALNGIVNHKNNPKKLTALRNDFYIEPVFIMDICCNVDTIKAKKR